MKLKLSVPAALTILLAAVPVAGLNAPLPPEAAALVNGVAVPRKALLDVVQSMIAQLDEIPDTATTEKYRRQALNSLIDFELLYQEGQGRELVIAPTDVADAIKSTEKSFPSPKAYQEALQAKGLTKQDIENETKRALMVDRVLRDVVWPGVTASNEQVQRYYTEHQAEFTHPEEVRASYILIRVKKGADAAARKAAKARADGLAQRARAGDDFGRLAQEASEDPATAQKGGDLGFVAAGTMGAAFDRTIAGLTQGQISDPVETEFGYVVIKRTGERPAGVASVDEVRERIVAVVKEAGRDKAQQDFIAGLREKAKIEVAPDLR